MSSSSPQWWSPSKCRLPCGRPFYSSDHPRRRSRRLEGGSVHRPRVRLAVPDGCPGTGADAHVRVEVGAGAGLLPRHCFHLPDLFLGPRWVVVVVDEMGAPCGVEMTYIFQTYHSVRSEQTPHPYPVSQHHPTMANGLIRRILSPEI